MLDLNAFSLALWFTLALVLCTLVSKFYQAYGSPLRDVQGPWLARFTRFWYVRSAYSRQSHKIHMDLHKKYGSIVRIAPNHYSIDDFEASKVIYRSRDPLNKVCQSLSAGSLECYSLIALYRRRDTQDGAYQMQNQALSPRLTMLIMRRAYIR